MSYNFINNASTIGLSQLCEHDSLKGYTIDLSTNGDVDGWDYYAGVHTYVSWGGFLFGTVWRSAAVIGRNTSFVPVPAETHYIVKIAMRIQPFDTRIPTKGKLMWRTVSNPSWAEDKSVEFDIIADGEWRIYNINLGLEQWWQGDVSDLRVFPIYDGI